nr:NAD(P)-binding domain-containing protein [Sphingomonas sp. CDS-1]
MLHNEGQTDVTVLGLGAMGAAFARTLIRAGKRVTVWNRTTDRATALIAEGAILAPDVAAATAASPLTLIILLDHAAVSDILTEEVLSASADRTLVNLTTAQSAELDELAERVRNAGAHYISGGIVSYPRKIGDVDTTIFYSGDTEAFQEHEGSLRILAGAQQFVGSDPSLAMMVYLAVGVAALPMIGGLFEAAAWAEARGFPPTRMFECVRSVGLPFLSDAIKEYSRRIASGDYDGSQASIDTFASGFDSIRSDMRSAGVRANAFDSILNYVQMGQDKGLGASDISALYQIMRE